MLLNLAGVNGIAIGVDAGSDRVGTLIHVWKQESGAKARLGVEARAPVAVSACSDLEIKGTVYPVFLSAKNRSQVFSHRKFQMKERRQNLLDMLWYGSIGEVRFIFLIPQSVF